MNTTNLKLIILLLIMSLWMFPTPFLADEVTEEITVQDLFYDAENAVLQGTTTPNANISIENVVGEIVADAQGHFAIPIDEQSKTIKLMIFDYLTNRSFSLTYDLINQTILEPAGESTLFSSTKTKTDSTSDSEIKKTDEKSKKSLAPPILFIVIILLGGGSLAFLAHQHRKN